MTTPITNSHSKDDDYKEQLYLKTTPAPIQGMAEKFQALSLVTPPASPQPECTSSEAPGKDESTAALIKRKIEQIQNSSTLSLKQKSHGLGYNSPLTISDFDIKSSSPQPPSLQL